MPECDVQERHEIRKVMEIKRRRPEIKGKIERNEGQKLRGGKIENER